MIETILLLLRLYWEFFKVGMFTFGGGYGAIPLIHDAILQNEWMGVSEDFFHYIIGVAESTPGPIMVNTATYIGTTTAGVAGAVFATLGAVTPSFLIILLIAKCLQGFMEKKGTRKVLDTIKPCVVGIILSTGSYFLLSGIFPDVNSLFIGAGLNAFHTGWKTLFMFALIFAFRMAYKLWKKKTVSPILSIGVAAVLGIAVYGI